eukprot:m.84856 g.84856  ORF g.84856 m.84856 type:complete len:85 (-) comp12985_c0_seq2:520-774(-)
MPAVAFSKQNNNVQGIYEHASPVSTGFRSNTPTVANGSEIYEMASPQAQKTGNQRVRSDTDATYEQASPIANLGAVSIVRRVIT